MASKFTSSDMVHDFASVTVCNRRHEIENLFNFNNEGKLSHHLVLTTCAEIDSHIELIKHSLPTYAKIQLLGINEDDALAYFQNRRNRLQLIIKEAFKSKRFDIETGAKVDWDFFIEYSGVTDCKTKTEFLKLMRADKISYTDLKQFEYLIQSLTTCTTP